MSQRRLQPGPSPQTRPRYARLSLTSLEDRTALSTGPSLDLSNYSHDHILVRYQAGQAPVALSNTAVGGAVEGLTGLYKVHLEAGLSVPAALAAYRADARVQLAEPDYDLGSGAVPNDPRFGEQWAWRNSSRPATDVDAPVAWDYQTGSSRMVVSVMDTGIDYTHPDLYRNIWLNQGEIPASRRANLIDTNGDGLVTFPDLNDPRNQGVGKITDLNGNGYIDGGDVLEPMVKLANGSDSGQGGWANDVSDDHDQWVDDLIGWNFVDDSNDPMDDFGHGTHVAGTIGAVGNNGQGVAGINWSIQMMPIKFMNANGAGSVSAFIAGLNYAVEHGAKISNNSWTGSGDSTLLAQAVQAAQQKNHIFVAAAGNSGSNNDSSPTYPASLPYDNVLSVAATDRNDNLAGFSNYGASSVDLAAPGVDILSTTMGGGYGYNSGTSMATPHVTGAAALIWARNPSWTYQMVLNRIMGSVDKVPSLSGKVRSGGRLNIGSALAAGNPTPVTPVVPPVVTAAAWSGPSSGSLSKVRITFDKAVALSSFTPGDAVLTGPGGKGISVSGVSVVAGSGDRSFDLTFATQTAAGDYSLRVGPEVTDVSGTKMTAWSGSFRLNAVVASVPPSVVTGSWSGPTANSLSKVRVTFDRAMNAGSFTAADVRLTGPAGKAVAVAGVQAVAGSSGKAFDITFATQTAAGSYAVQVGPEVTDSAGAKMKIWSGSFKVNAPTAPAPAKTYVSATRLSVAPNGKVVSLLTVGDNVTVADLNVKLTINHPRVSDLYIHLQAPDGTNVVLANRNGGGAVNMTNTVFDDEASLSISGGKGPFTGTFKPVNGLYALDGKSLKGTWKLWVEDKAGVNRGTLESWGMTVTPRSVAQTTAATPPGVK
ncbi:MAG: S8 family serine peptidase [Gemmataceae bacterium]